MQSELIERIKSYNILNDEDIKNYNTSWSLDSAYKWAFVKKRDEITKNNLENGTKIKFRIYPYMFDDGTISTDQEAVYYDDFIKNGMSNLSLIDEDEVVLFSSYINLRFAYPCENTVFKIKADDIINGFTKKELALKAMQYYHLLYQINNGYNFKKGIFDGTGKRSISGDWEDNGLSKLVYDKHMDEWEFVCVEYM